MIAPQDLRLGNVVLRNGIVVTVDNQTFWDVEKYPDQYEPIELTEYWLLKFGFKPAEFHDFLYKNIFIINYGGKYYRAYLDGKTKIDVELKCVHQIQNLTFALTGEELKIKES